MKVAIVQYDPQLGQVDQNMRYVDRMIASYSQHTKIDILMLSEMAFTGYVFKTKKDVEKVAEIAGNGKTFEWCRTHALKLGCMVICGYVEKTNDNILYNSMMVISSSGELECNPRKHFLYETDKPWAASGEGFTSCYSPSLKRKISFGICMDINPNDFKSSFDEYEYANHVVENESELVFFSCAWCDFEPPETDTYPTIAYWAARLTPIIQNLHKGTYPQKNCYFLCANRIGNENGTFFVGASCVLSLKEPQILAQAGRREEKVLFVEIPL